MRITIAATIADFKYHIRFDSDEGKSIVIHGDNYKKINPLIGIVLDEGEEERLREFLNDKI